MIINRLLKPNLRVDLGKDFAPIALATLTPNILVVKPALGVSNVKELIALAKGKAGPTQFRHLGLWHLAAFDRRIVQHHGRHQDRVGALSRQCAGADRSARRPHPDHVFAASTVLPHVESGELRVLATSEADGISTPPRKCRPSRNPDCPALTPAYGSAVMAPVGTPRPVVDRLAAAINAKRSRTMRRSRRYASPASTCRPMPPDEFAAYIASETKKWEHVDIVTGR